MKLGKYTPQFVYGGFDGVVTTFAVVAAAAGAGLSSGIVVVLGLANLIADGFSMGASAYLSRKSELHNNKDASLISRGEGLATFWAFSVVGLLPVAPYIVDVVAGVGWQLDILFAASALLALVAFIIVGTGKADRSKKHGLVRSLLETLILGVVAAALAYFLGDVLSSMLGL